MPLLQMWKATPASILSLNLDAIVKIAGDSSGSLLDGSENSHEFRSFLQEVEYGKLAEYAEYSVDNVFKDSGQVLQDIINEIGRRLGFRVENGRYRGVRNDIGYDGIWTSDQGNLVIEVKTTGAYTIKLDVVASYRDRLAESGRVAKGTPILIVIGEKDTKSLEAQVRGSEHARSVRIIGIEALSKLMEINIKASSRDVTDKIHTILRPFEYTRIDSIVDVIFTATEDKEEQLIEYQEEVSDPSNDDIKNVQDRTPIGIINDKKDYIIRKFSNYIGESLIKRKNSLYADSSDRTHVVAAVSKSYQNGSAYWYAYHNEPQRKFLSEAEYGYLLLGMVNRDGLIAIPFSFLESLWDKMNSTVRTNGSEYKHIFITEKSCKYYIRLTRFSEDIDISNFIVK